MKKVTKFDIDKVTKFDIGKVIEIEDHRVNKMDNIVVTTLTDGSIPIAERLRKLSVGTIDKEYYKLILDLFLGNRVTQALRIITKIVDNNGKLNDDIIAKISKYIKTVNQSKETTITLNGMNSRLYKIITIASRIIDSNISEEAIINNSFNGVHVLNNKGRVITTTTHDLIMYIRELIKRNNPIIKETTCCDYSFLMKGNSYISLREFDLLFDLEVD